MYYKEKKKLIEALILVIRNKYFVFDKEAGDRLQGTSNSNIPVKELSDRVNKSSVLRGWDHITVL